MTDLKDKGATISIATIGAMIPVLAFTWFVVQPLLLNSISESMADEFQEHIDKEQQPLELAFKTLLRQEIEATKRSIALLEYRRQNDPESWLEEHARLLADRYIQLQALEEAYSEL